MGEFYLWESLVSPKIKKSEYLINTNRMNISKKITIRRILCKNLYQRLKLMCFITCQLFFYRC